MAALLVCLAAALLAPAVPATHANGELDDGKNPASFFNPQQLTVKPGPGFYGCIEAFERLHACAGDIWNTITKQQPHTGPACCKVFGGIQYECVHGALTAMNIEVIGLDVWNDMLRSGCTRLRLIRASICMRMMLNVWKWYQKCLAVHPVKTQIISSGFLWGLGDIAAQSITHSTLRKQLNHADGEDSKINWKRVATTSMFGFGFVGPIGHFWYEGLDRLITYRFKLQPKSMRFVTAKVAIDGFMFGPLDLFIFFSYMGLSAGKSIAQVKEDVKRDFIPAFFLEGGIWPLLQIANFRYIPVRYQLLYVNIFCLIDSAFLSWIEQQEDAHWKQWFTSLPTLEEKERS